MIQPLLVKLLNLVILLSGVAGFIKWKEIRDSYWRWFPFYLILIGGLSTLGNILIGMGHSLTNQRMVIFLIIPIEFIFAFWLLLKKAETKPHRILILTGMGVYLLSLCIETWIKSQKTLFFPSISYTIGNIFMLIFILYYFWKLSVSANILAFYKERMFWVSTGMLFFWLGSLPYFGLFNLLSEKFLPMLKSYALVMLFLNYLMYLLFAASFLWGKEN